MTSLNLRDRKGNIRATEIITRLGNIDGPNVVLTDSEYEKLKDLSRMEESELDTGHKVYEVRVDITRDTLQKWKRSGFDFTEVKNDVQDKLEGHGNKITVFRPRVKPLQTDEDNDRVPDKSISLKDQKMMIRFAASMGFDWVAVYGPKMDSPDSVYRKRLQKVKAFVDEEIPDNIALLPHVNIKSDSSALLEKMESASELGFLGVMVKMGAVKTHSEKLSTVRTFSKTDSGEEVFIYGANLPRYSKMEDTDEDGEKEMINVSMRLAAPRFGVDLIGYENRTWGGRGKDSNPFDTKVNIPSTGTYWAARTLRKSEDEDHSCFAPCCGGDHPRDIIEGSDDHDNLEQRIWLHEVHSVKRQLKVLREALEYDKEEEFYRQRDDIEKLIERELS